MFTFPLGKPDYENALYSNLVPNVYGVLSCLNPLSYFC